MMLHIGAAMAAGATGTIVTNPIWVIKTRFMVCYQLQQYLSRLDSSFLHVHFAQTQPPHETRYRHTLDAFITIYRREGIGAFYRGLVPSLLGVSHVAVQFPLYEELKVWFGTSISS